MSALSIEEIRSALQAMHRYAIGESSRPYMQIPANPRQDADLILAAAIDELEQLRGCAGHRRGQGVAAEGRPMTALEYQRLYEELEKQLTTPEWRAKLQELEAAAGQPLRAELEQLRGRAGLSEYQVAAARTLARKPLSAYSADELRLKLAVMGLGVAGEAGEVVELLKKHVGHGHELPPEQLKKELGDVLWYVAAIATLAGFSLDEVAQLNIAKLKARYPEGFSEAASKNRGPA